MENVSEPSFIERHMSSSAVCVRNLYSLLAETFTVKLKSFFLYRPHKHQSSLSSLGFCTKMAV